MEETPVGTLANIGLGSATDMSLEVYQVHAGDRKVGLMEWQGVV